MQILVDAIELTNQFWHDLDQSLHMLIDRLILFALSTRMWFDDTLANATNDAKNATALEQEKCIINNLL